MAILMFLGFGVKMPVIAPFDFFLGYDPLNGNGYRRNSKRYILVRKDVIGRVDTNGDKRRARTYRVGQKSDTSRTYITLYERYHFFGPPGIYQNGSSVLPRRH